MDEEEEVDPVTGMTAREHYLIGSPNIQTWSGVLLLEDEPTVDGRLVLAGALTLPTEPLPLCIITDFLDRTTGVVSLGVGDPGPQRAVGKLPQVAMPSIIGMIDQVERVGKEIRARGRWFGGHIAPGTRLLVGADLTDSSTLASYFSDVNMIVFTAGRLARAVISDRPCWPEAFITIDEDTA